jgi:hypothetical protein
VKPVRYGGGISLVRHWKRPCFEECRTSEARRAATVSPTGAGSAPTCAMSRCAGHWSDGQTTFSSCNLAIWSAP